MTEPRVVWAAQALTAGGWRSNVRVEIGADGRIADMAAARKPSGRRVGVLLPAPVNLHSHAFQRAMAGLAERRSPDRADDFWSWRALMYEFLQRFGPEEVEAVAAFAQMEMLEAGFAAVAEFHYLHHRPGGAPYGDLAELSRRIAAAARASGIGLTLLPVLYERGGCDGRPVGAGQLRFANDRDRFARLLEGAWEAVGALTPDARSGIAIHSLRAVPPDGVSFAESLAAGGPVHIHAAEQPREVEEVRSALGARPVEWLLANARIDDRWCVVHATHMTPAETSELARSGAVAGLCPITEANLGDGVFPGRAYREHGGSFGVGSDSNVRISLCEELRTLEYGQRLQHRARTILAPPGASNGRALFDEALRGGAAAAARPVAAIAPGALADLLALDAESSILEGKRGDEVLDAFVFAGDNRIVTDVWSAGRHMVTGGAHIRRNEIRRRYARAMRALRADL